MPNHLPFLKSFTLQGEFIQSDTSMLTIKTHKVFHFHFLGSLFPRPIPKFQPQIAIPSPRLAVCHPT